MLTIQDKLKSIIDLQSNIIGLYKPSFYRESRDLELIISKDEINFETITVGSLLGISNTTYSTEHHEGNIKMFPNNKTLAEFLNDPFEFNNWYIKNI